MAHNVLDRVKLLPLVARTYIRVFEPAYGDVLSANPNASGRLSLKQDNPRGATHAASWYIAETLRAAMWETVLRDVDPDDEGGVFLDLRVLAKYAVQSVKLLKPGAVLRLEPAARRHVIAFNNHRLNSEWDHHLTTAIYETTHVMAGLAQLQCRAADPAVELPGISWRSRQADADLAYVLYVPPCPTPQWAAVDDLVRLDTPAGHQLIRSVLAQDQMVWLNDPGTSGGTPPPGAI
ncbi:RES domain-containing protein [Rhodanobacter sp. FW106-PBR-LB-2-11]|uniref:RES domain-containing protein n=1 Tax=Rhodanobacter sp. FW106-PBR-LB-2-11 TaxID=1524463 RepID=UPI0034E4B7BD